MLFGFQLIPCGVYSGVAGLWAIKPFWKVDNKADLKDPYFAEGYRQVAFMKQAKRGAIGAVSGLAIGFTTLQLMFK